MPTRLRKLKITRVAVCDQGANQAADILLFKSLDPVDKQEGAGVGDVYADTFATSGTCTDPHCNDATCPVHGATVRARRKKKRVAKGPVSEMGMHAEPDGDEEPPLDYRSRGQQYDLWEQLWGKWECFCTTFYDIIGDSDEDNVPYLPILVQSIEQFGEDVQQLLDDCGIAKTFIPRLDNLRIIAGQDLSKAGAAMAGHRLTRLKDAIAQLQQILAECTPEDCPHGIQPPIDRAGLSAAEVTGFPALAKGGRTMAVAKDYESDKEHCDNCESDDCDNPAHDRMKKERGVPGIEVTKLQTELATLTAELATTKTELAKAVQELAARDTTIAKMRQTPEEQEAEWLASLPEAVRKRHEADAAEKVELRKQLDEARAEREQTVYISKAATYRGFGLVEQHWRLLKAIDRMEEEDRDELLRLMKAASERDGMADIYRAAGTEGRYGNNGSSAPANASEQLMTLTQAYMDEKGVDFLKASEAIAKSHRELYQEATHERRLASRTAS